MAQGNIMLDIEFRSVAEPILNEVHGHFLGTRPTQYDKVFEVIEGIKRSYHEEVYLGGLPVTQEKPEGTSVSYSSGGTHYETRLIYKTYGLAFAISKEALEDTEQVRLLNVYSNELMVSSMERREINGANVLNFAFNSAYTGTPGDGQSLIASAHPLFAPGPTGTNTLSNVISGALSQTSVEAAVNAIRSMTDNTGRFIPLEAKKLIVPPALSTQGKVILESYLRSGTANNDMNPITDVFSGGLEVMQRLTSSTAWFIQTNLKDINSNSRGLFCAKRREHELSLEGSFDTDSMRVKVTDRHDFRWHDWRDCFGSTGT